MKRTILINAGPWLSVPPEGYGGIENVLATLIPPLRERGHRVVLATVGTSRITVDEMITVFDRPQFANLARPYNRVAGIAAAHQSGVVATLRARRDVDLVHDHVEALGPSVLCAAGTDIPPVLHTLHWDLTKHPELYSTLEGNGRLFVNGVSSDQLRHAPARLRAHSLGHVHLATPLADRPPGLAAKGEYLVVLARICPAKGQHIAARLAHRTRTPVVLAGPVGPFHTPGELAEALRSDRARTAAHPDVAYWLNEVTDQVDGTLVRWVGTRRGAERDRLVARARATLCPLQWDEPGGTGIVESLALGTPVVGYRRGCLPELLDERTGLLAAPDDEDELVSLLDRVGELDPAACQHLARQRYTPARMATDYIALYDQVQKQTSPEIGKDGQADTALAPVILA